MMDFTINIRHLLGLLLWVALLYFAVKLFLFFVENWIEKSNIKWQKRWLFILKTLITPSFAILLALAFFVENPLTAVFLIFAFGWFFREMIVNYWWGIHFKLNKEISKDANITCGKHSGSITEFETLGLWLNTEKGKHYIHYNKLYELGYTVNDSAHIATLFSINIEKSEKVKSEKLKQLIAQSPFLESDKRIIILDQEDHLVLKLNLRSPLQHQEIVALLKENGYKIIKY